MTIPLISTAYLLGFCILRLTTLGSVKQKPPELPLILAHVPILLLYEVGPKNMIGEGT